MIHIQGKYAEKYFNLSRNNDLKVQNFNLGSIKKPDRFECI